MRILMLKTVPGSVDGIKTAVYEQGKEYGLARTKGERDLALAFIGAKLAKEVESVDSTIETVNGPIGSGVQEGGITADGEVLSPIVHEGDPVTTEQIGKRGKR